MIVDSSVIVAILGGEKQAQAFADALAQAPFRHMVTPGGHRMSIAMTNCGAVADTPGSIRSGSSDRRDLRPTTHSATYCSSAHRGRTSPSGSPVRADVGFP